MKDDEDVQKFAKQWQGVGPSFTLTKKGENIVIIIDIKENGSKKLEKIDMIPSYKKKKIQRLTEKMWMISCLKKQQMKDIKNVWDNNQPSNQ